MIEQQGRVTAAQGGHVRVRLGGTSGCSACDEGKGCGAGVFGRLLRRRPVDLDFPNTVHAQPGQAVIVGLPESLFLALALRLYLYPLLAAMAGAVAGHVLAGALRASDLWTDVSALAAAVAAAAAVVFRNKRHNIEFSRDKTVHLLRTDECKVSTQCTEDSS